MIARARAFLIYIIIYVHIFTEINVDNPALCEKNEKQIDIKPLIEDKTTSEILDLLTEIKNCKDMCITESNFHPCPWCSGKLITV